MFMIFSEIFRKLNYKIIQKSEIHNSVVVCCQRLRILSSNKIAKTLVVFEM